MVMMWRTRTDSLAVSSHHVTFVTPLVFFNVYKVSITPSSTEEWEDEELMGWNTLLDCEYTVGSRNI